MGSGGGGRFAWRQGIRSPLTMAKRRPSPGTGKRTGVSLCSVDGARELWPLPLGWNQASGRSMSTPPQQFGVQISSLPASLQYRNSWSL